MPRRTRYTEKDVRDAVAASLSYSDVLRRLGLRPAGGNFRTIQQRCRDWGISTAHFDPAIGRNAALRRANPLRSLEEVLVEGSSYDRASLKRRLYAAGLKVRRCELCGQGEDWRGARMSLILDHINGVGDDNRLENLQIVCPNCAATLMTHCGRNNPPLSGRQCVRCGAAFQPERPTQRYCSLTCGIHSPGPRAPQPERRKVERPPYAVLLADLEATNFEAVGRKYGVSGNAVRKWLRWYEQERNDEAA